MSTLRGRLTVLSALVVALAFSVTGLVILTATGRAETQRLERDLSERLAQLGPGIGLPRPGGIRPSGQLEGRLQQLRDAGERTLGPGFFLVARTGDGTVALTLGDAPASLPPAELGLQVADGQPGDSQAGLAERFVAEDGRTYLVRGMDRSGRRGVSLQMGADLGRLVADAQEALRSRFLVVGAIATALTALVTSLIAGVATRPLQRLREATERVAATEDLTTRVHLEDAPGEVEAVAEGLNTMLARLQDSTTAREAALHAARRFAADAGHELRTPLTSVQSTLDTLVRNPGMPEGTRLEVIDEVAGEARRLATLLDSLQALARADAGLISDVQLVDVGEVIDAAIDAVAQQHPDIRVVLGPPATMEVRGSPAWLRSILDNLLRNAALHARRADGGPTTVTVTCEVKDGWGRLLVDDDGPGIPPDLRRVALQRFTRGADTADRPGSGLGLSLVAQLAALHGGALLLDTAPAGGLRAEIRLPLATPASAT